MSAAKVYRIAPAQILALVTGRARIRNLPADAQMVGFSPCHDKQGQCLGLRVHSASFTHVAHGEQLPVVVAVIESIPEAISA